MRSARRRILALVPLTLAGCVEREFTVRSIPPGARLQIDRDEKGTIPDGGHVEKFSHYGVREIILAKEGYLSRTDLVTLRRPFYQVIPIDFIVEILNPFTIHDRHGPFEFTLQPIPGDSKGLAEEAEAFRKEAHDRVAKEPGAEAPPGKAEPPAKSGPPAPAPKP